jgi:hypothetical protein
MAWNDCSGASENTFPGQITCGLVQSGVQTNTYNEWQALTNHPAYDLANAAGAQNTLTGQRQSLLMNPASSINANAAAWFGCNWAITGLYKISTTLKNLYVGSLTVAGVQSLGLLGGITTSPQTLYGPCDTTSFSSITDYNQGQYMMQVTT